VRAPRDGPPSAAPCPKPVQTKGCHRLSYLQPPGIQIAVHSNL
jgi:hypothetical protein